jgi:transketolase
VPEFERPAGSAHKGGYIVRDGDAVILAATGSEVSLALDAAEILSSEGIEARIVSLPCWEAFFEQEQAYREMVLGGGLPIVSIEAGSTFGWDRITGGGPSIGIDRFGASAPAGVLAEEFGFTAQQVAARVREWLGG